MINVMFLGAEGGVGTESTGQSAEVSSEESRLEESSAAVESTTSGLNNFQKCLEFDVKDKGKCKLVQILSGSKIKMRAIDSGEVFEINPEQILSVEATPIELTTSQETDAKQPEAPLAPSEPSAPDPEVLEAARSLEVAQSDLICVGDSVADGFNSKALSAPTSKVSLKAKGTKAILENLKRYNFKPGAKVPIWCGYNDWGNKFSQSYENIIKMAEYIKDCGAKPVICVPHNVNDSAYPGKFDNSKFKAFQDKLKSVKDFPVADFSRLEATSLHPPKSFYVKCKQILNKVRV